MTRLRIGSFGTIAAVIGAGALAPSNASAQENAPATTPATTSFFASEDTPTTNLVGSEEQRILVTQRQDLLRRRLDNIWKRTPPHAGPAISSYQEYGVGLAGGDGPAERATGWASFAYSDSEDDFPGTAYDSELWTPSVGADYKLTDQFALGGFFTYNNTDTTTVINRGNSETDGYSFGGYASYRFNDYVNVDATGGYITSDIENTRLDGTGLRITGDQDSDGHFWSTNLNGNYWIDNWSLGARVGFNYSDNEYDPYTESTGTPIAGIDSQFGQFQVGGTISYFLENWLPYFKLTYGYDFEREDLVTPVGTPQPANDDDEIVLAVGTSLFYGPWSGALEFSTTETREDFDSWAASFNLSCSF